MSYFAFFHTDIFQLDDCSLLLRIAELHLLLQISELHLLLQIAELQLLNCCLNSEFV